MEGQITNGSGDKNPEGVKDTPVPETIPKKEHPTNSQNIRNISVQSNSMHGNSCFETVGVWLIVCIDDILILAETKELVLQSMDALI